MVGRRTVERNRDVRKRIFFSSSLAIANPVFAMGKLDLKWSGPSFVQESRPVHHSHEHACIHMWVKKNRQRSNMKIGQNMLEPFVSLLRFMTVAAAAAAIYVSGASQYGAASHVTSLTL